MVVSIALAAGALRAGFMLRRARAARRPAPRGARQHHLRLAKAAVVLLPIGFVGGMASAVWLRGWSPFATFHGVLGALVLALFSAAAVHGRRLERGRRSSRQAHALFGVLAVLGAALAAVAGFVLLP
jgi:threonine/homoserine efflux transporter RhtA